MRTLFAVASGLLLWCTASLADDQAAVRDFVARYDKAYLARDTAGFEGLLASDYRVVVEGKVHDRAGTLSHFADPARTEHPDALSSTVDRAHVSGDLAVAVGRIEWKDGDKAGHEHYTLVLRREGGQWRAVEEHISDVASGKGD